MRIKFIVLVSHPIQYFAPVYRALAQHMDLDFTVLYRTRVGLDSYFDPGFGQTIQWDIPLLDGYRSEFLSSKSHLDGIEWSIIPKLLQHRPDVLLLHGYNQATNLLALLVAKLIGTRVLIRGDTRLSAHHGKSAWKKQFKQWLFRGIDGCVSIGSLNRNYYEWLGMPSERIYFAPFCIDNDAFDLGASRSMMREKFRRELGIELAARVIVFASKLTVRKRVMDLISAMAGICKSHSDVILIVAGSGSEETALLESAAIKTGWLRFVGFKNQSELPVLFAASDLFVLPSSDEPWGLVVNEAMAAGLPVIVSDDVGAAPDLVEGKDTGLIFPVGDIRRLADALEYLLDSPEALERMGRNARAIIKEWSVSASAEGIARAVHSVVGCRARH